jgi:AraC-like DNA-binding protein
MKITDATIIPPGCEERFLQLAGAKGAMLWEAGVTLAGLSRLVPGYRIARTCEIHHFAVFTLEGGAEYRTINGSGAFSKGDLFVGPAHASYEYAVKEEYWQVIWFLIADCLPWSALDCRAPRVQRARHANELASAVEGFWAEGLRSERDSVRMARLYAEVMLACLQRELALDEPLQDKELRARFHALWHDVSLRLGENWTVARLADESGFSPTHLHRLCRRLYGCTPLGMVRELRLQRAEELLLRYEAPLDTIAEQVGYGSPYAFSRAFLKSRGQRPGAFRRGARGRG